VVDVLLPLRVEYRSGAFYLLVFFLFIWMYASVLPLGYCIVAEARCNWYLSILKHVNFHMHHGYNLRQFF
jgi:hypothetical protein